MAIRITSDSTCDLGNYAAERNVGINPMTVILDGQIYHDGVDITPEDIFKFVADTKQLPKTSATAVEEYKEFFEKELEGYDGLIHFNISAKSSVTHSNAKTAAEYFGGKVRVIDSMALSTGQGLLVLKACDLRDEGKSLDDIEEAVNSIKKKINTSFIPDSLDYLKKGGRVSGMVNLAAAMFKIHPAIVMQEGQLVPGKKYKGRMSNIIRQYV
ncbi:MAG: DegV family protein, partial [Clostridia bacterium]|nr:DegV family protein [Clostridia bacterium]